MCGDELPQYLSMVVMMVMMMAMMMAMVVMVVVVVVVIMMMIGWASTCFSSFSLSERSRYLTNGRCLEQENGA